MTIEIDKYRSLYTAKALNGYVIVYANTYKKIVAPFTKAMSMLMFKREFEYVFPTQESAENGLKEIEDFIKGKQE